ncbi:MAG: carboxypeptidase regulatory-like domain-containing protein [Blastocatellia bacterium]|nr:carboxypeptidase regulatory-like domain-containing protein [Blastocatellia bacterium]
MTRNKLETINLAFSCPMDWDKMAGDNQTRYCPECKLNVHNISSLSSIEATKLINSNEKGLCIKLYRRLDGTVLTKDCSIGIKVIKKKITTNMAVASLAILLCLSNVNAQTPVNLPQSPQVSQFPQKEDVDKLDRNNKIEKGKALVIGMITDETGAVIPGAEVIFIQEAVDPFNFSHKVTSNENGIYSSFLPSGKYKVQVNACGFVSAISEVEFKPQEKTNLEITLLVSNDSTEVEIGIYIGDDASTDLAAPTEIPKLEPVPKFRPYLKHKKN